MRVVALPIPAAESIRSSHAGQSSTLPTAAKIAASIASITMRHHAKSCVANGFYSVGVGAPLSRHDAVVKATNLSPSLRFLEHLTMEISVLNGCAKTRSSSKKQYAMTVHHAATKASWRHCHSLDDYRAFHERLLELMDQGHFCLCECPYLYTFLQRSFPKQSPLLTWAFLPSDRVVEERRVAIVRTLETLQSALLNPHNHGCDVLANVVATELVAFLYGKEEMAKQCAQAAPSPVRPWEMTSPLGGPARGFAASIGGEEELKIDWNKPVPDDSSSSSSAEDDDASICCSMCALSTARPVCSVLATWRRRAKAATPPTDKTKTRSSSADTTMLSQFVPTPRASQAMTPPAVVVPENAVLSPPRQFRRQQLHASKRFALGETTVTMLQSLRLRMRSPATSPCTASPDCKK